MSYVVIGGKGVYLKPILEDLHFERFEVSLLLGTLIGTCFGTAEAVVGFIFDKILGQLIASQIPLHLDVALRDSMAKIIFPILEAHYAAQIAGLYRRGLVPLEALYASGPEGFLFSSGPEG
jgi:hypothetical protein